MGIVSDEEIRNAEIRAWLLVSPSSSKEEIAKYFFPSKLTAYMQSGTPVLATRLPGIPGEYFEYIYPIEDETPEGMRKAVQKLLDQPREILHEKGARAKEFVFNNKTNVIQARKIMDLIAEI
jgi:glycosyltransferase involved in cell wall biosynthesis